MERPQVSDEILLKAIEVITVGLGKRLQDKGRGAFSSSHEALGVITEEYDELLDAVRGNDIVDISNETIDIAVACVFSIASFLEKEEELSKAKSQLETELEEIVQD